MMYEMLTGKLPFEGETALQIVMQHINEVPIIRSAFVPGIPKGMDDIVMHAESALHQPPVWIRGKMYGNMDVLRSDPNERFHYVASGTTRARRRSSARTFSARRHSAGGRA